MRTLRKKLAVFVVLPIATLAVLVFAASWYLSGLIGCRGFKPIEAPAPPDVEVVSQESTVITLRNTGIANKTRRNGMDTKTPKIPPAMVKTAVAR